MDVKDKRVLVVGLARSGLAVARALVHRGALVTVLDRRPPSEFGEVLPQLVKAKVGLELGSQREETFLRHEVIVISPGVPWDLPQLQAARERQIPVYPEVEAATWFLDGTLVGVTGSNGKTTTTALLGDMLKASGFPTFVGGNIGNALSLAVEHSEPGTRFVTELSSFQLEGIHQLRPRVAVMLNLSPNHLDRHPSLEAYAQAKRQIFRNQQGEDYAVLNADDTWVAGLQAQVPSCPVLFSRRRELADGVFVSDGKVYYRVRHLERVLFETRDVALRGDFNLEDVLAATTAACLLGADFAAIRQAVREFKAVEHRLEFVREIHGVDFYNNSKATSVDATLKSLEAFEHGVHLIMGGKDKGAPYTPLLPLIKERVREVLLIGAAAPVITEQLRGSTELVQAGDLATAVYEAFARSRPGDTVLLAPACSSFDQFKDYEERGRVFKELVNQLHEDVATSRVPRPNLPAIVDDGPPAKVPATPPVEEPAPAPAGAPVQAPIAAESPQPPVPTVVPKREEAPKSTEPTARIADLLPVEPQTVPEAASPKADTAKPPAPQAIHEMPLLRVQFADEHGEPAEVAALPLETLPPGSDSVGAVGPEAKVAPSRPDSAGARPDAPTTRSPAAPHHVELTYVYEVDAMEMPSMEPPPEPEFEPELAISAGTVEPLDDDTLPFEVRPLKRKSGTRSQESGAPSSSRQKRLPGVE